MARLRSALARDSVALSLLDLVEGGATTPAEQAAQSGLAIEIIRNAWRRIDFHATKVARDLDGASEGGP